MIPDIRDADFDAFVERSSLPVLAEFWQPGCGHCQSLLLELELVQLAMTQRILIVKMNVEENFQIPAELEIQSLPALALFHRGEFIQFVGGIGKVDQLVEQLTVCLQALLD